MILVTKLNKKDQYWINENLIEFVEETPDTVVSMATGRKVIVAESAETLARMIQHNNSIIWSAAAISKNAADTMV